VNTALDVSMPMRLISDMDGSCLGYMTAQVWHPMPWGRPPQQACVHLNVRHLPRRADEGRHPRFWLQPGVDVDGGASPAMTPKMPDFKWT
jgi:hypothetical protein